MRIRQTMRHVAARAALEMPLVRDKVHDKLVELHTRVFLERAPEDQQAARREHLDAFFDRTLAIYLEALRSGYTEAGAREITHILANLHFRNKGWVEMMEFPVDETEANYDRYRDFFEVHGITERRPLGDWTPDDGLPSAPATPDKLEDPDQAYAEEGYADDLYVEDGTGQLQTADPREDA